MERIQGNIYFHYINVPREERYAYIKQENISKDIHPRALDNIKPLIDVIVIK